LTDSLSVHLKIVLADSSILHISMASLWSVHCILLSAIPIRNIYAKKEKNRDKNMVFKNFIL